MLAQGPSDCWCGLPRDGVSAFQQHCPHGHQNVSSRACLYGKQPNRVAQAFTHIYSLPGKAIHQSSYQIVCSHVCGFCMWEYNYAYGTPTPKGQFARWQTVLPKLLFCTNQAKLASKQLVRPTSAASSFGCQKPFSEGLYFLLLWHFITLLCSDRTSSLRYN